MADMSVEVEVPVQQHPKLVAASEREMDSSAILT